VGVGMTGKSEKRNGNVPVKLLAIVFLNAARNFINSRQQAASRYVGNVKTNPRNAWCSRLPADAISSQTAPDKTTLVSKR